MTDRNEPEQAVARPALVPALVPVDRPMRFRNCPKPDLSRCEVLGRMTRSSLSVPVEELTVNYYINGEPHLRTYRRSGRGRTERWAVLRRVDRAE